MVLLGRRGRHRPSDRAGSPHPVTRSACARRGGPLTRPIGLIRNYIFRSPRCSCFSSRPPRSPPKPRRSASSRRSRPRLLILCCRGSTPPCFRARQKGPGASGFRRSSSTSQGSGHRHRAGIMFSFISGADVGGLFTALGVTSIVSARAAELRRPDHSGLLCCSNNRSG